MNKKTSFKIKAGGKTTTVFHVKESPDGSKTLVLFPEQNKKGFHATEHPSGIANIRTTAREIDLYDIKRHQLIDQVALNEKIKELIEPIKGVPIAASIIFKRKVEDNQKGSMIFDLDEFLENVPYGKYGIHFSHLRHNRINRLQKYIRRKDVVIIYTSEGLEYAAYSLKPLFGMRMDSERLMAAYAAQPIAKIFDKAFPDS